MALTQAPAWLTRRRPAQQRRIHRPQPLREAVETSMRRYFEHLDGGETSDLYAMVMAEVETPLLASVMEYTNGNQTRAAKVLGLNRGTLRKKLKAYGFIDSDAP